MTSTPGPPRSGTSRTGTGRREGRLTATSRPEDGSVFPLMAVGGREEIMRHFAAGAAPRDRVVVQIGTLSGNPISAAAGLATLRILQRPGTYERMRGIGRQLKDGLQRLLDEAGIPARVASPPLGTFTRPIGIDGVLVPCRQPRMAPRLPYQHERSGATPRVACRSSSEPPRRGRSPAGSFPMSTGPRRRSCARSCPPASPPRGLASQLRADVRPSERSRRANQPHKRKT
jgi:hypothetical protein